MSMALVFNVQKDKDFSMTTRMVAKHAQQTHTAMEQQNAKLVLSIALKQIMSLVPVCNVLWSMDQTAMMASAMSVRMESTAQMAEDASTG